MEVRGDFDRDISISPLLTDSRTLWTLLRSMIRIRLVEEKLAEIYPSGRIRTPMHLCVGQEAVPAVVSSLLFLGDTVFSGHRSHGHYLAKGGDLTALFAELFGNSRGCSLGLGGSQHLCDPKVGFIASAPILAGTVPVAVGYSWKQKQEGNNFMSVAYIGDAVIEEGVFHESVSFAALHNLPILFVCENNLYSVHAHLSVRQPTRSIASLVAAHGLRSKLVDGYDIDSIYQTAANAIADIRTGKGPWFIEATTYRMLEHVGPSADWHLGYRSESEGEKWTARDPIEKLQLRLVAQDLSDSRNLWDALLAEVRAEIENSVRAAETANALSIKDAMNLVYPGTA